MAGTYADVPGQRMAWDRDGTAGFNLQGGVVGSLSASENQGLNDENDATMQYKGQGGGTQGNNRNDGYLGVVFPEARDIQGYFIAASVNGDGGNSALGLETSTDTTNGLDGTWTNRSSSCTYSGATSPYYRSNIISTGFGLPWSAIKGVRIYYPATTAAREWYIYTFHLFGSPTTTPTNDLALWHPTSNAEVTGAYFDWGDTPRGTTATRTFRVKNRHATLTATGISVSFEALTPGSPSIVAAHDLSTDNATFGATISPADLAAGAISPVLYIRRTLPAGAQLGVWAGRIVAVATAFS